MVSRKTPFRFERQFPKRNSDSNNTHSNSYIQLSSTSYAMCSKVISVNRAVLPSFIATAQGDQFELRYILKTDAKSKLNRRQRKISISKK